jgi:hypothetical protein
MIETNAITESGAPVACPHCRKTLFTVLPHRQELAFEGYLYTDSDTVPISPSLSASQSQGFGSWDTELMAGECPFCRGAYFAITVILIDAMPDDEFRQVYFYRSGDRGEKSNFTARHGNQSWVISRFDTPLGPMLEHEFGPFADTFGKWIGSVGVASCEGGGPWDFAKEFLLMHWDALRAMPKALALDPASPLAQPGPVNPRPARPMSSPLESELDDDIPF